MGIQPLQVQRERSEPTSWRDRRAPLLRRCWDAPAPAAPPRRARADGSVVALTVLLGLVETLISGLGCPLLRVVAAVVIAGVLLQRRRAPLTVLMVMVGISLATNVALRIAGHFLLLTGLMLTVAVYALIRWASGRDVVLGLAVVVGHAIVGSFVNPNWSAIGSLIFYASPVLLAYALRLGAQRQASARWPGALRVGAVGLVVVGLLAASGGSFLVDQLHSFITRTKSPSAPAEWAVDAATLRRAAESSRGTHGPDGAIIHTVDYPHQLLAALEQPTFSAEADVTVIDGEGFLQHDPKEPVGLPLLEFLEYAAIAEFPIVKLDLKCDRVGPIIDEVQQAVDRFGLDPRRVHFNADVFRGPGVGSNLVGARTDLSFTDAMYNLIVMELETSDLLRIANEVPEATIAISSTPPKVIPDDGYSERHLEQYVAAANEVRAASPSQPLVFVVRGDLAARSDPAFLPGLSGVDNSYVAAWWSEDVPPTPDTIETLRSGGVTFFDLGEEADA